MYISIFLADCNPFNEIRHILVWQVRLPSGHCLLWCLLPSLSNINNLDSPTHTHTHLEQKHTIITPPCAWIFSANPLIWGLDFFCGGAGGRRVLICHKLHLGSVIHYWVWQGPDCWDGKTSVVLWCIFFALQDGEAFVSAWILIGLLFVFFQWASILWH